MYLIICDGCDGEGEVECENCDGTGDCCCTSCEADHPCGYCDGEGKYKCETCDGAGKRLTVERPAYIAPVDLEDAPCDTCGCRRPAVALIGKHAFCSTHEAAYIINCRPCISLTEEAM